MPIKLAIGCYHKLLGEALKKLIVGDGEISIAGVFSAGEDLNEIGRTNPDVILLDLLTFQSLPDEFSLPPKTKILLIGDSSFKGSIPDRFEHLISKGLAGILPSEGDLGILKKALRSVSSGELWFGRKLIAQMIYHTALRKNHREKLSNMEKKVAALICQGRKNKEIARELMISEQTVKSHCNRIYKKMEVSDRLQLAIKLGHNRNP